jgi:serine/threonine protein kinase
MLAHFDISEVVYGQLLGAGGFSDVHEVTSFEPLNSVGESVTSSDKLGRAFMTKHAKRENSGEARYAIKFLQRGITYDRKQFNMAAQDLETEAEILSKVSHPNIIKIRGTAIGGAEAYLRPYGRHDSHFLLLDRLNGTLDRRLENWKKLNKKLNHPLLRGIVDKKGLKRKQLLTHRLQVAADLAGAFEYLHDNNYIYR